MQNFILQIQGGTGKIYRKYKKINSLQLDESFFPILWTKKGKKHFNNSSIIRSTIIEDEAE